MKSDLPPLAQYKSLSEYLPAYGDYVIWSGWITTWHGIVSYYDSKSNELHIIFSGVPFLLFTMGDDELQKETKAINLAKIKNATQGSWAILQHDYKRNTNIWYI